MSALRTTILSAALTLLAPVAEAQTPTSSGRTPPMADMASGGAVQPVEDRGIFAHAIFNQLEGRFGGGDPAFRWDGQGWVGTDYNKLWIKSEGAYSNGTLEDGQQQFLYARAISTYFDLQGGLRSDLDSRPNRNWAAFGFQGLAPYFFDLEVTGFVSGQGHLAAKVEASYDLLITQRLILQPEIESNLYSKADPARLVGAGFSDIDAGLRLRYELSRKFAPYLGVVYEQKFAQTATFARQAGAGSGGVRFVAGLRVWF